MQPTNMYHFDLLPEASAVVFELGKYIKDKKNI